MIRRIGIAALLFLGLAGVVLARAAISGWPAGIAGVLGPVSWVVPVFLVLNTLGNLVSGSRCCRRRRPGHSYLA